MFIVPPQSQMPSQTRSPSTRAWVIVGAAVFVITIIAAIVILRQRSVGGEQDSTLRVTAGVTTPTEQKTVKAIKKNDVLPAPVFAADAERDGVSDEDEKKYGTDPAKADTDGDGISDGEELNSMKTDPLRPNSWPKHPSETAPTP